jgi:hypothetical protein
MSIFGQFNPDNLSAVAVPGVADPSQAIAAADGPNPLAEFQFTKCLVKDMQNQTSVEVGKRPYEGDADGEEQHDQGMPAKKEAKFDESDSDEGANKGSSDGSGFGVGFAEGFGGGSVDGSDKKQLDDKEQKEKMKKEAAARRAFEKKIQALEEQMQSELATAESDLQKDLQKLDDKQNKRIAAAKNSIANKINKLDDDLPSMKKRITQQFREKRISLIERFAGKTSAVRYRFRLKRQAVTNSGLSSAARASRRSILKVI